MTLAALAFALVLLGDALVRMFRAAGDEPELIYFRVSFDELFRLSIQVWVAFVMIGGVVAGAFRS